MSKGKHYVTECMSILRETVAGCLEYAEREDQRAFLTAAVKYVLDELAEHLEDEDEDEDDVEPEED